MAQEQRQQSPQRPQRVRVDSLPAAVAEAIAPLLRTLTRVQEQAVKLVAETLTHTLKEPPHGTVLRDLRDMTALVQSLGTSRAEAVVPVA